MGPEDLSQILQSINIPADDRLLVGFDGADDAAVFKLADNRLLLQTVDFFTPVVDNPYDFGQIAAANSLSDIYAMGGTPLFALNIVGFPIKELPREILTEILQGGIDKAQEAGITIAGGHSIDDKEPKYGLVVTGEVREEDLLSNSGAQPGDILVLTKPLGTGIIATAIKQGVADKATIETATAVMSQLNRAAIDCTKNIKVNAGTDITGFGLLGHLGEMCRASQVSAVINFSSLPKLPQVDQLIEKNLIPGGTRRNLSYADKFTAFSNKLSGDQKLLAADAQTSGGLLLSIPPAAVNQYLHKFGDLTGQEASPIGEVIQHQKKMLQVDL
ncbi:MAG: selenide, water dikinase SelD [Candidatus Marinimicrobia bacterium]|nr:selenide, water dikinase SelD [Candidatus Neomarinimicrobiota bacterium]